MIDTPELTDRQRVRLAEDIGESEERLKDIRLEVVLLTKGRWEKKLYRFFLLFWYARMESQEQEMLNALRDRERWENGQ